MKVHYKRMVADQILEEIHKARRAGREIECIELDDAEMIQFRREISGMQRHPVEVQKFVNGRVVFGGVDICKEDDFRGYGVSNRPSRRYQEEF